MTPETDISTEYSQKSLPENVVQRRVHDKLLSQKKYNELFLRIHIYPKLIDDDKTSPTINVIDDSNQVYSTQNYHYELAERYAEGKLTYVRFKELWKSEAPFIVPDDSNPKYSEKSDLHEIVEGYMHGKISMDRYNELFSKVYDSTPSSLGVDRDSFEYKKNQIINKVIGFMKKLGIFEK